jgi:membrane-bound lytic murein transglycosylase D
MKGLNGKRKAVFRIASQNIRSQLGQKDFFMGGLVNSGKYLQHMEEEFSRQGLPLELTRIPFVESSFNEKAQSKVGASGVWQIMPKVGRSFFRVSKNIDERNSPLKATSVAAKLLKTNYRVFKNWPLAVTAYNNGIGNLRKAVHSTRSSDIGVIITRYKNKGQFGFASANFYASFLAALHAERYHTEIFGDEKIERLEPISYRTIALKTKIRGKKLIQLSQLPEEEFLKYNMDLKRAIKRNSYIPHGHTLLLPEKPTQTIKEALGEKVRVKNPQAGITPPEQQDG